MSERGHGSVGEDAEAIRVRLLGGFRISVGDRTLPENAWRLRKAASLVKLLALAPRTASIVSRLWRHSGPT
jgi:DNA-binding SARP family transcriptional activator